MGLILLITALVLIWILLLPAVIIGTFVSLTNHTGNRYYYDMALSLDQFGNVMCQHLFNIILITKEGYRFGDPDKTVSYVTREEYIHRYTYKNRENPCMDTYQKALPGCCVKGSVTAPS
jgi:hypothetical protein